MKFIWNREDNNNNKKTGVISLKNTDGGIYE